MTEFLHEVPVNGGRVFQINLSDGGVPKRAVIQAEVTPLGLTGDRQIHTEFHGGPERAVCLYSLERILALQAEGHPVFPGAMGENLTLSGVDWEQVGPGTVFSIGEVQLEVTRFTTPCNSLTPYFIKGRHARVSHNANPGWSRVYTRVLVPGVVRIGDEVRF